jgi:fimbrial chaperone protein
VLLQFSVPVFAGDGSRDAQVTWSLHRDDKHSTLEATNTGARRAKFSGLVLVDAAGRRSRVGARSLVYVLAGATRRWDLDMVAAGGTSRLEGNDEMAHSRLSIPLASMD